MKLSIELVPKGAWGNNLRSYLTKAEWDTVRKKCYSEAGYCCEICGGKGSKHPVECHERWDFSNGKVKLIGLIALCPSCHEVKHIGLAQVRGRYSVALKHFMKVNQTTQFVAEQYIQDAFSLWRSRNQQQWELDIGYLQEYLNSV